MKREFEIDVKWFGKAAADKVMKAAMKGLKQGAVVVSGESQKLAPVLSGTLKRSICVTEGGLPDLQQSFEKSKTRDLKEEKASGQQEEAAVYVTANTPYAHKQHEENRNHSKFLERGLQNAEHVIPKLIEGQLKKL